MEIEMIIQIIYMILFFIIGSLFGSFFSLATYRLPRKQDILIKRSYCPKCNHELGFWDLIPIASYLARHGKCKYCGDKISPRYIGLEVFNGIFFLANYLLLGLTKELFLVLALYVVMFVFIGSSVMEDKMKKEMSILNTDIEKKKIKSGVFNLELLVAVFAFIIYYVATIYITRNYNNILTVSKQRSEAMNIAVNLIENSKSKDYSMINDIADKEVIVDDKSYICTLSVEEYSKNMDFVNIYGYYEPKSSAKKITATVSYTYKGKTQNVSFNSVVFEG